MFERTMLYSSESTKYDAKSSIMTGRLTSISDASSDAESDRKFPEEFVKKMALLEEHEKLNTSLAALTCHVAHVQLRLQQVISASTAEDRENLLFELHKFASNGVPDVMCQSSIFTNDHNNDELIEAEKRREKTFINELKQKLDELERYALASGSMEGAPTSVMIEKQHVLIDELREKLDLPIDESTVSKLSAEELRKLVDQGIHQITSPVKVKEKLIHQMRTEIGDLENFIEFLKTDSIKTTTDTTITSATQSTRTNIRLPSTAETHSSTKTQSTNMNQPTYSYSSCFQLRENSLNIFQTIKRIFLLTQLYTFFFLTCGKRSVYRTCQPTTEVRKKDYISKQHFGDLRAQLEIAIVKVLSTVRSSNAATNYLCDNYDSTTSDSDNGEYERTYTSSTATIIAVRQDLASALRALLEHGLHETNSSRSLCPWGCFSARSVINEVEKNSTIHIWQLFLKYYNIKHGDEFTNSPARKLSESFGLDLIDGHSMTFAQYLLSGIDTISKLHMKHPRQMDRCFKSFICYALNERKLVTFLRLILHTPLIVENYYQSWSYTKKTGFSDALHSLDRLTSINFRLPINTYIYHFDNTQDLIE